MNQLLQGVSVLVTRPAHQAETLCELIEQAGGQPIRFPTLSIEPIQPSPQQLLSILTCDWLIFVSANAVNFARRAFGGTMPASSARVAAIGAATAKALRNVGINVDALPSSSFTSETLLALPEMQAIADKHCVIVRGLGGREYLAEQLKQRGATVDYLQVYRRRMPETNPEPLLVRLANHAVDAVTITSGEALDNLLQMMPPKAIAVLQSLPLLVVSTRLRQRAECLGFQRIAVSEQADDTAILKTLIDMMNGDDSGRSN